jgi:hypothetical protein
VAVLPDEQVDVDPPVPDVVDWPQVSKSGSPGWQMYNSESSYQPMQS